MWFYGKEKPVLELYDVPTTIEEDGRFSFGLGYNYADG